MKERYAQEPPGGYTIDKVESTAIITFRENSIMLGTEEENEVWEADKYILVVPYRDNLEADIKDNFEAWINAAKAADNSAYTPSLAEQVEAQAKAIEDLTMMLLEGGA